MNFGSSQGVCAGPQKLIVFLLSKVFVLDEQRPKVFCGNVCVWIAISTIQDEGMQESVYVGGTGF